MLIHKNSQNKVSANFKESEFYSGSFNAPDPHELDERLVLAAQIIRDFFGIGVIINSTLRTPEHNSSIGGASRSQHLLGTAMDFAFADSAFLDIFYIEITEQGELYHKLKALGINGFGMYDTFMHIDTRSTSAFWDNTSKKKAS